LMALFATTLPNRFVTFSIFTAHAGAKAVTLSSAAGE